MPRRKKRFGQHHLRHPGLCRPAVEFLRPRGRTVVEIGPGGGVLTRALIDGGARVLAMEIDPEWAFALRTRLPSPALSLAVADALDLRGERLGPGTLITGNLPFQVATRLIERVLSWRSRVPRAAFLVQLEVAERLLAGPGSAAYGSLSVLTAALAEATRLGRVDRRRFHPVPKVDAAFVGLTLRSPPVPESQLATFKALVRLAFGHRRKTLRNALAAAFRRVEVEALLDSCGLERHVRAESLALEQFVELHRTANEQRLEWPPGWS